MVETERRGRVESSSLREQERKSEAASPDSNLRLLSALEPLAGSQQPCGEWRGEAKLTEGPLVGIYAVNTSSHLPD